MNDFQITGIQSARWRNDLRAVSGLFLPRQNVFQDNTTLTRKEKTQTRRTLVQPAKTSSQ
jgi:hypothetical protein